MSDELFTHDAASFDPRDDPAGATVSDHEAKYADLFAEVIWDGVITPDKRKRLDTAAGVFGLSPTRAGQIEQALSIAHEASHQVAIVEQATESDKPPETVAPLAAAKDPRLLALQRRITVVEQRNGQLVEETVALREHNESLEVLVAQLQHALESTLNDLDEAHKHIDDLQPGDQTTTESATESEDDPAAGEIEPAPASLVTLRDPGNLGVETSDGTGLEQDEFAIDVELHTGPDASGLRQAAVAPAIYEAKRRWRSRRVLRDSQLPSAPAELDGEANTAAPALASRGRGDPSEIHRRLIGKPRDVQLLRALFRALQRTDDLDRRWCIAHTLVYLGAANDEERAVYERHTAPGLVRPSRAVNEDEWPELLFHPDEDRLTGQILAAIAPAVLLGQMTAIRASIAPELVDPEQRVDPKTSTIQAVRCVAWAAAFLGLEPPPLYACPDFDGTADIVLSPTPSTRLGKGALVGRSSRELAFVAGEHLCWYRKEHLLGKPTRSMRRLEDMFVAALMIGNPGLPITPEIKKRVEPIARTIRPLLDEPAIEQLQQCFAVFVEQGGRTNLAKWLSAVERTASCTGLLLANDLKAAEEVLRIEDPSGFEGRMDELLVFFTAGRCSLLRKRIGIAIEPIEA